MRSNQQEIAQERTRQLGDTAKQDLLDALEAPTANKLESSVGVIVPIRYAESRQVATKEDLAAAMDEHVVRKPSSATGYASAQAAFEQGLGAYKSGYYEIAIPALEEAAAKGAEQTCGRLRSLSIMPARFLIVAIGFVVAYRWTRPNETIWPSPVVDTISRNLQPAPDTLASKREFSRTAEFVGDKLANYAGPIAEFARGYHGGSPDLLPFEGHWGPFGGSLCLLLRPHPSR